MQKKKKKRNWDTFYSSQKLKNVSYCVGGICTSSLIIVLHLPVISETTSEAEALADKKKMPNSLITNKYCDSKPRVVKKH